MIPGKWLEYSVSVATAGSYDLAARVASGAGGGTIHVSADGVDVSGALSFGSTGGWDAWRTITRSGVALAAGAHVVRLSVDAGALDLNWIAFAQAGGGI